MEQIWHKRERSDPPEALLAVYTPTQFTHQCGLHHTQQIIPLVKRPIKCSSECSIKCCIALLLIFRTILSSSACTSPPAGSLAMPLTHTKFSH